MNAIVEIEKIGNAVGIVLPAEVLAALGAHVGDKFVVTANGLRLSSTGPDTAEKMAIAEDIMREDHAILNVLAQ